MTALSANAQHYTEQFEMALALNLVEALRAVQSAQWDSDKANVLCQSDDYERVHHDLQTAKIELWKVADRAGIDFSVIRDACNA